FVKTWLRIKTNTGWDSSAQEITQSYRPPAPTRTPSHFPHASFGNLAEGEGIEPPVALASARQFSGLVTLPTRPPLLTIWRRRQGLEPVRFAQGKLCTRVTRTVLARRCDADSAHISTPGAREETRTPFASLRAGSTPKGGGV